MDNRTEIAKELLKVLVADYNIIAHNTPQRIAQIAFEMTDAFIAAGEGPAVTEKVDITYCTGKPVIVIGTLGISLATPDEALRAVAIITGAFKGRCSVMEVTDAKFWARQH